jgi:TPR repeat protein
MRRLLIVALLFAQTARSGDLEDAWADHERKDYELAFTKFRSAAEKGDAIAQTIVGWMYDQGEGVARDYKEAVRWYRLATTQGFAAAQLNLGVMYAKGHGVAQD